MLDRLFSVRAYTYRSLRVLSITLASLPSSAVILLGRSRQRGRREASVVRMTASVLNLSLGDSSGFFI